MAKTGLYPEDSTQARWSRRFILIFAMLELLCIAVILLQMICVGYMTNFTYSIILILLSPYIFAFAFEFVVVFLPYDRFSERGVILLLIAIEATCAMSSAAASIWRGILIGRCDEDPCKFHEDCCIVILVINAILILLSLLDVAAAALLYNSVIGNPTRKLAIEEKKRRKKAVDVELKKEQKESEEPDDDDDANDEESEMDDEDEEEPEEGEEDTQEEYESEEAGKSNEGEPEKEKPDLEEGAGLTDIESTFSKIGPNGIRNVNKVLY